MSHIEQGYYKYQESADYVHYGHNVYNIAYTLLESQQDSYNLPVDGWYFFETPQAACQFFNINIEDHDYLIHDSEEEHSEEHSEEE